MILAVSSSQLDSQLRAGFVGIGVILSLYSFYTYYLRIKSLEKSASASETIYYDLKGPLMLASSVTLLYGYIFISKYSTDT